MKSNIEISDLPNNPFELFELWYKKHQDTKPKEPTAAIVATADKNGRPSARTVLLKSYDEKGFVFFTNYESQKGHDLNENPQAQMLFYWESLGWQVRIYGQVEKVSASESDTYFASRPYLSQIGAWASNQSQELVRREDLVKKFEEYKAKYAPGNVPRPAHWGGYRIIPKDIEFWIGRENRLHDRFVYSHGQGSWKISRLSP